MRSANRSASKGIRLPRRSPNRSGGKWGCLWDIVILAALIYGNVLLWGGLGVGWDDVVSVIADARAAAASFVQDFAQSRPPSVTASPAVAATRSPAPTATAATSVSPTASASPTQSVAFVSLRDFTNGPWLEQQGPRLASAIKELGWLRDGIDDTEAKAIQDLLYVAVVSLPIASLLVSLDWVQDGIDDVEAGAIRWLNNMNAVEVVSSVVSLDWVRDGIDDVEVKSIESLSYIAYSNAQAAASVVSLGWVQDGIAEVEADLIESLAVLARDTEAALRIVGMPFLATIEPPDMAAIMSLRRLVATEPEVFARLMSHATLQDGISNELAPVVATLYGVARTNPGLISVLLDPARVSLEQRTITLPLSGKVVLSIIRTGPGAARSMDLLEHSVRGAEQYMDVPLPTNYVGVLYENAVFASNAGTNFGTHVAILPKYDVDDGGHEAAYAGPINAHEVAHYYWSGNEDWVDEGAANFLASIIDSSRPGSALGITRFPCAYADSIAELESLGVVRGDVEFYCNYSLGERIFADLRRALGEKIFRQGFRKLYLASEAEDDTDNRRGTSVGINHVREAFRSKDGAESTVIDRWYNGSKSYDLSLLDTGPVYPSLSSINGRIDEAYVTANKDGPAVSSFSTQDVADWGYLTLKYSYNVSGGPHEVPWEIVEYYEDGFEFRRRSSMLTAEDKYSGGTAWFSIGPQLQQKWALGRYWVYVYVGGRKVAEVQYEVTP